MKMTSKMLSNQSRFWWQVDGGTVFYGPFFFFFFFFCITANSTLCIRLRQTLNALVYCFLLLKIGGEEHYEKTYNNIVPLWKKGKRGKWENNSLTDWSLEWYSLSYILFVQYFFFIFVGFNSYFIMFNVRFLSSEMNQRKGILLVSELTLLFYRILFFHHLHLRTQQKPMSSFIISEWFLFAFHWLNRWNNTCLQSSV